MYFHGFNLEIFHFLPISPQPYHLSFFFLVLLFQIFFISFPLKSHCPFILSSFSVFFLCPRALSLSRLVRSLALPRCVNFLFSSLSIFLHIIIKFYCYECSFCYGNPVHQSQKKKCCSFWLIQISLYLEGFTVLQPIHTYLFLKILSI